MYCIVHSKNMFLELHIKTFNNVIKMAQKLYKHILYLYICVSLAHFYIFRI